MAAAPSDAARSISSFVGSIYKISPELKSVTVRLSENVTSSATNRAKKKTFEHVLLPRCCSPPEEASGVCSALCSNR